MSFASPQAAPSAPAKPAAPAVRQKVRIRFTKTDSLRLVSHHDLMKCVERMVRRAGLPIHHTGGFHPTPRIVFAQSLALGIVGRQEVLELELDAELPLAEIHGALAQQAPPGMQILSLVEISIRGNARPRRAVYRLPLPAERSLSLKTKVAELLDRAECWIERARPQPRRIDVRPFLRGLCLADDALEIDIWVTPQGSARPEEIASLLGLADVLDQGVILERTLLELHDETLTPDLPPTVIPRSQPLPVPSSAKEEPERQTALVPGPLSFDS